MAKKKKQYSLRVAPIISRRLNNELNRIEKNKNLDDKTRIIAKLRNRVNKLKEEVFFPDQSAIMHRYWELIRKKKLMDEKGENETMDVFLKRIKKEKPDLLKSLMKKAKNEYLKEKKERKEKIKDNAEYPNDVKSVATHLYHNEVKKLYDKRDFEFQNYRAFLKDIANSGKLDFQVFINKAKKMKDEDKKQFDEIVKELKQKKANLPKNKEGKVKMSDEAREDLKIYQHERRRIRKAKLSSRNWYQKHKDDDDFKQKRKDY